MRDVENTSATLAERYRNEEFSVPVSRLSDIETKGVLPSIYRLYSLSVIYRRDLREVLSWYGVDVAPPDAGGTHEGTGRQTGEPLLPGDAFTDNFSLETIVGRGSVATLWKGRNRRTGQSCVIKVFSWKESSTSMQVYVEYLKELNGILDGRRLPNVLLPTQFGVWKGYFYEILPFLQDITSLGSLISRSGSLSLQYALEVLADLSKALGHLHKLGVIHADLKPSNILVDPGGEPNATILDFGMAKPEADGQILLFSTLKYLHPSLGQRPPGSSSDPVRVSASGGTAVGPYLDIYSAGLIAMEMLTGSPTRPEPLVEASVRALLEQGSPSFASASQKVRLELASLVFRMLSVTPVRGVSAPEVAERVKSLGRAISQADEQRDAVATTDATAALVSGPSTGRDVTLSTLDAEAPAHAELREALERIEKIGRDLVAQSAAFIAQAGSLKSLPNAERDQQMLSEVHAIFDNSLKRTQSSWKLGVIMTVVAFACIVAMIASAIVLTVVTGKPYWGALFGTLGVSSLIGTLVWRPFDRIFRATIISQQIEMIHVQTVAGFRGTTDLNERMRICDEAFASLQTLFREHSTPESKGSAPKQSRSRRA
jgi:serine/threonine protein kinase